MSALLPKSIREVLAHPAMARAFRLFLGADAALLEFHYNMELFKAMSQKDSRETDRVLSAHARTLLENCLKCRYDDLNRVENPLNFSNGIVWEMESALRERKDENPIEIRIQLNKVSAILARAHEEVVQHLSSTEGLEKFMQSELFKSAAAVIRKEIAPFQKKLDSLQQRLERLNGGAPRTRLFASLCGGVDGTRKRLEDQIAATRLTLFRKTNPSLMEARQAAGKVWQSTWSVEPEPAPRTSRVSSS